MIICPLCLIQIQDIKYHSKICMANIDKITIEIRKDCKECGKDIVDARYRTFCCTTCRIKFHNRKRRAYQADWIRNKRTRLKNNVGIDSVS